MSGSRSHCEVGLCNQRRKNVRFFNTVWPTIESSRFKDFRLKKQVLQPRPKTLYVVLHVTRAELGMPSDRSRDQRGLRPRPHLCKASDLRRVGHDPDIAPLSGVSSSRLTACLGGVSVLRCGERGCVVRATVAGCGRRYRGTREAPWEGFLPACLRMGRAGSVFPRCDKRPLRRNRESHGAARRGAWDVGSEARRTAIGSVSVSASARCLWLQQTGS